MKGNEFAYGIPFDSLTSAGPEFGGYSEGSDGYDKRVIVNKLRARIPAGTCFPAPSRVLQEDVEVLARRREEEIRDSLSLLAMMISAMNVQCSQCLNEQCKLRDPAFPFLEVAKAHDKAEGRI